MRLTKRRRNLDQYLMDLRFSQRWPRRAPFSGMLLYVIRWKRNEISEGYIATIFRQQGESCLLPESCCFHAFRPWKWRRYVTRKHPLTFTGRYIIEDRTLLIENGRQRDWEWKPVTCRIRGEECCKLRCTVWCHNSSFSSFSSLGQSVWDDWSRK
jgi:hypothetical protein